MSGGAPVEMYWDSDIEALRPTGGWLGRARKQFVAGEIYHIVQHEPRSAASHNHYFARVLEVWKNLSEDQAERFPTEDHLRRYALIRTGWCNRQEVVCGSRAAAIDLANIIKSLDTFAVVDIPKDGAVAAILTARSQSQRAMGREDFQKSKDDVLGFLANLIEVTPKALAENTGKAA
jgi:hypothetical protein